MNGTIGGTASGTMTGEIAVDLDANRMIRMTAEMNAQTETQRGGSPLRMRMTTTAL